MQNVTIDSQSVFNICDVEGTYAGMFSIGAALATARPELKNNPLCIRVQTHELRHGSVRSLIKRDRLIPNFHQCCRRYTTPPDLSGWGLISCLRLKGVVGRRTSNWRLAVKRGFGICVGQKEDNIRLHVFGVIFLDGGLGRSRLELSYNENEK